jgi:hypothetical protein
VTSRVTYHLSPTATITATMIIRRMHSRTFIGLLRDILWTRSLDEDEQGQENKFDPVPYHILYPPLVSR